MGLNIDYPWVLLAGGWLLLAAIMAALWVYQKHTRNAGFVDVCRALASRGDAYRAYQRTTNAFFPDPPWPDPKANPGTSA